MQITLLRPASRRPLTSGAEESSVVDPSIDDILDKWKPKFPALTGDELISQALEGAEDEAQEHGGDGDLVARQHLWTHPYYYRDVLWPAEKAAGIVD